MDRRESLKSMFVGTLAGGMLVHGCAPASNKEEIEKGPQPGDGYGRTPKEKARDAQLMAQQFLTVHESETLAVLCDIILPENDQFGSAQDAGVVEFMAFIVKDIPDHQLPIRGGIMWLDNRSNVKYNLEFKSCSVDQQKALCDEIAYPDVKTPELQYGINFFSLVRNLTLTGYYTTKMGLEDLGYKGNTPNTWDGVPEEVLKEHGMSYDEEWLAKCVDQSKRANIAKWDDEGNFIA